MRFLSTLAASVLGSLLALGIMFLFGFLLLIGLVAAADSDATPGVADGSVLVVPLEGNVPEIQAEDPFAEAFGNAPAYDLRGFVEAMEKAAADERIRAVWLQLRSAPTAWATLGEMRRALERYKESGKPLYATADDRSVSETSYYLASVADSIVAQPEGIFEFNGFILQVPFFSGALDKLGVEPQLIRAGQYKSAGEPFIRQDFSEANEEQYRALLEDFNARYLDAVAEARGLTAAQVLTIQQERPIFQAEEAYEAGLLDALMYHDEFDDLLRDRLGLEADEDIPTVDVSDYIRVPREDTGLLVGDREIAVVYAIGAIVNGEGQQGSDPNDAQLGPDGFRDAIVEAREDDDIEAVVVRINSPGGSASASEAIRREIALTAAEKPVIISMSDLAASGGYWIAMAGDTIVADPLTLTGSIGVFALLFDAEELLNEKLGITFDQVATSDYADLFSGVEGLTDAERQLIQNYVTDTYQSFLRLVAESRDMSVEQVDELAQGRVWTGQDALQHDLVDELGGLDLAIALAAERVGIEPEEADIRVLPRPQTFLERFSEQLEAQASVRYLRATTTPQERLVLDQALRQAQLLGDAAAMHGEVQARLLALPMTR